ncbi:ABC transporter substrate-binding protein [Piscibacillus halophilus]|uniref:Carbohydrate ABC transporter substrate-binding protein, CUT1 family n=1 Tax=Piscibacillus halophilus TaxID=571933 RepID=A0A1H9I6H8_9BACI|nr:extracellular solute-binding protein [Piscibacillus halophilus]SEQ70301.1 carbohydrate ABC transporter substrate-binding protein, CUT1 family [Piscibacillus halophilus]
MKLKSFWVALLLGLVLVLSACSGGDSDDESAESNGEKITIFQTKVEISEQMEELAEIYEEETGVEVEVWGTTGDDYFQQLQTRLNSNQGPSILSLQDYKKAENIKSYLHDLSGEEFIDNIAPNMAVEIDGEVVGIPYGVEGFGLVYNKDLVSEEDIQDYDSFVNTLERLSNEGVDPLTLSSEAYFLIGHMSNYPFSLQEDHFEYIDQLSEGEVTMTETPEFQEFGKFLEAIREYSPNPMDYTYDEQMGDFATGKTAMVHQGNWAMGMLADYDYDFEVGMMPFPLAGNDKLAVGVGANWAVNGTKDEAEIEAAVDFLEWLHTSETGQRFVVEEFGFVPAMTNIEANDLDVLSDIVLEYSNSGETIPWAQNYYPASVVTNDFMPAAQDFFLDENISGEDFIQLFDEAWQNAVK